MVYGVHSMIRSDVLYQSMMSTLLRWRDVWRRISNSEEWHFLFGAGGIYICFMLYSIVQEHLAYATYGDDELQFHFFSFLMVVQTAGNACFGFIVCRVQGKDDPVPWYRYLVVSATYVFALGFSQNSLRYISYPTKIIGKACKPIPVLLVGITLFGRKYPRRKWISVGMICLGVTVFMLGDLNPPTDGTSEHSPTEHITGYWLLGASAILDAMTTQAQEMLCDEFKPTAVHILKSANCYACLFACIPLLLSGELPLAFDMMSRFPAIIPKLLIYCFTSALGQYFIWYTLRHFGALTMTTTTTTRKFFTLLISIVTFGHSFEFVKWCGIYMVFGGIGVDIAGKYMDSKLGKGHPPLLPESELLLYVAPESAEAVCTRGPVRMRANVVESGRPALVPVTLIAPEKEGEALTPCFNHSWQSNRTIPPPRVSLTGKVLYYDEHLGKYSHDSELALLRPSTSTPNLQHVDRELNFDRQEMNAS